VTAVAPPFPQAVAAVRGDVDRERLAALAEQRALEACPRPALVPGDGQRGRRVHRRHAHVGEQERAALLDAERDVEQVPRVVAPHVVAHVGEQVAHGGVRLADAHHVLLQHEWRERVVGGPGDPGDLAERDEEPVGAAAILRLEQGAQLALAERALALEADRAHLGERVDLDLRAHGGGEEQQGEAAGALNTHGGRGRTSGASTVSPWQLNTSQREMAYSTSNAVEFNVEFDVFGDVVWL
jgi:hypothetical protein